MSAGVGAVSVWMELGPFQTDQEDWKKNKQTQNNKPTNKLAN